MQHARWQEAEASCSVRSSSMKVASAAAGTEPMCSLFTATCMTRASEGCLRQHRFEDDTGLEAQVRQTLVTCFPTCMSA